MPAWTTAARFAIAWPSSSICSLSAVVRAATHQLNVLARLVLELHATAAGPDAERLDEHVLARDDVAAGEGREARGGDVGEELLAEVVDRGHGAAGEDDGARDIDDGAERGLGVEQEVAERD